MLAIGPLMDWYLLNTFLCKNHHYLWILNYFTNSVFLIFVASSNTSSSSFGSISTVVGAVVSLQNVFARLTNAAAPNLNQNWIIFLLIYNLRFQESKNDTQLSSKFVWSLLTYVTVSFPSTISIFSSYYTECFNAHDCVRLFLLNFPAIRWKEATPVLWKTATICLLM